MGVGASSPHGGQETVVLRAWKDSCSEAIHLTRAAAEARRAELEADGWTVEIDEVDTVHS